MSLVLTDYTDVVVDNDDDYNDDSRRALRRESATFSTYKPLPLPRPGADDSTQAISRR